jgi:hypothetical protein
MTLFARSDSETSNTPEENVTLGMLDCNWARASLVFHSVC